ncbi:ribosomal RNA processing protein 1 homolog A-like isoform X1 [Myripristis murdjan]|uniref:Ribosomal RNA processing protein 1 homolog A-like n=1 Tax=Myripristis murdjan TaxID=586833 RepID=A0A667XB61_9TELE|nr:ribosomal RNA processing protein 1 homolog A-like isoform X1 [Myripristis murdjan]XP_029926333.1 ribosomal RNA processing protein 1 homolog A-like isoform X1 [Myripristis murdjan]
MATIQEAEVQFAQRLASNDKPTRTKALKKLRKYISVRSQNGKGGFTGDELLKLWKGLFYCLWMQDKPLLQEELSKQISGLLHSFQSVDSQLLYVESFLQTFKREWTGIDRLRMDKFFQLVRFMFRQTFEMLRRKQWDSSVVSRFLELLTAQVLQSGSAAPMGLQYHILDLYMTELAAVGSAELTADQNLVFIDPFCKTAAKTKDQTLLRAICSSIFSTIIDQAPFAIEDLMKELKAADASDSDSGQASEEEEEPKAVSKKTTGKQMNGTNSDEEDDLLHLEDSDTELADDGEIGPVLQFDFASLADKLFELASRSNTPNQNRQRLYKIIKVLRNLSEGIFPQDEYPEEVSTDEDDEMFGSRKRMKRKRGLAEEEEGEGGGGPTAKKRKGVDVWRKKGPRSKICFIIASCRGLEVGFVDMFKSTVVRKRGNFDRAIDLLSWKQSSPQSVQRGRRSSCSHRRCQGEEDQFRCEGSEEKDEGCRWLAFWITSAGRSVNASTGGRGGMP